MSHCVIYIKALVDKALPDDLLYFSTRDASFVDRSTLNTTPVAAPGCVSLLDDSETLDSSGAQWLS